MPDDGYSTRGLAATSWIMLVVLIACLAMGALELTEDLTGTSLAAVSTSQPAHM
jgi:hypothetical protein